MVSVEVPFVEEEIDSEDPSGSAVTAVFLVLFGGLFFMGVNYARRIGDRGTNLIDSFLGTQEGGGGPGGV